MAVRPVRASAHHRPRARNQRACRSCCSARLALLESTIQTSTKAVPSATTLCRDRKRGESLAIEAAGSISTIPRTGSRMKRYYAFQLAANLDCGSDRRHVPRRTGVKFSRGSSVHPCVLVRPNPLSLALRCVAPRGVTIMHDVRNVVTRSTPVLDRMADFANRLRTVPGKAIPVSAISNVIISASGAGSRPVMPTKRSAL